MNTSGQFYQAGFFDFTPVSDLDLCVQIPRYECPVCEQTEITNYYNYPHLDLSEVISKEERKRLGPVIRLRSSDAEVISIVWRLREKWGVPVTAGTIFGPTRVKVTSKPKADFHVLVNHAGLLCRRPAAEKLLEEGLAIKFVDTPSIGKYGPEADYVEFVVPVAGHAHLPEERSFCTTCLRYTPAETWFPKVLVRESLPTDQPFFKILETGTIVFNGEFIELVTRLGITGFVEDKTLHRVYVVRASSPRPKMADLEAARLRKLEDLAQRRAEERARRASTTRGASRSVR